MKLLAICTFAVTTIFSNTLLADDFGTQKDAEAMVQKAVAHIKSAGTEAAYADFTGQKPEFINHDIYVVVYDLTGKCLAHG